jgi:hypothetical protein
MVTRANADAAGTPDCLSDTTAAVPELSSPGFLVAASDCEKSLRFQLSIRRTTLAKADSLRQLLQRRGLLSSDCGLPTVQATGG